MSMWEISALVEESVRAYSRSGRSVEERRSRYWNLFEYEARYDTSFTHFRTMGELLAVGYVYRFEVAEHPDYADHREYFDAIDAFTFVEPPGSNGSDGGYIRPPWLYCDAGSPLWQRFVATGRLTGPDAVPPEPLPTEQIALEVASLGEGVGDHELVATWYRSLAWEMLFKQPLPELRANPTLQALRDLVRRTDALSVQLHGAILANPSDDDLAEEPTLAWWFDLIQETHGHGDQVQHAKGQD
jgi:aryl carrier-like protein